MSTGNRRVWFEGGGNYQSRAILGLMRDTLCKAGEAEDVEVLTQAHTGFASLALSSIWDIQQADFVAA